MICAPSEILQLEGAPNNNRYSGFSLNFPPADNKPTTYTVQAVFEGDASCNATAYGYLPNGALYTICTTLQYGFKPSTNTTSITVEPQATQVTVPTKTLEEIQAEAESSGLLKPPEARFSWRYPWFSLHFIGQYAGETIIDVGIDLFGGDTGYFPNTLLKTKTNEWNQKISLTLLIGILATEGAIWLGSHLGIIYFGAALFVYSLYKFLSLYANWNSVESLQISLESTFISLVLSIWSGLCSFLPEAWRAMAAATASMKSWAFAFLCKLIMIPLNIYLLMMTWDRIVALGGV